MHVCMHIIYKNRGEREIYKNRKKKKKRWREGGEKEKRGRRGVYNEEGKGEYKMKREGDCLRRGELR